MMNLANPAKPAELKVLQGNPGKRALRTNDAIAPLEYGYIEPIRPLGHIGKQFWDSIFGAGELWISIKTDTALVQYVCELMDRRQTLMEHWEVNPTDRTINMNLLETEKAMVNALSLLGFSPSDRTRLGFVSAKTKSKLEQLLAKKAQSSNA